MLNYLARAELDGVEIRLIESNFGFCLLYGMDKTFFRMGTSANASERAFTGPRAKENARAAAWHSFKCKLDHAARCAGIVEPDEPDELD